MTPITFTALFVMIVCLSLIVIGFYYIGFQDGVEKAKSE